MKTKYLFQVLFLLICIVMFSNCHNDNDFHDEIEKVKVYISAETDMYLPFGASFPIECMLVKEEKQNKYSMMNFSNITDFTYEKGCEYNLLVEKRVLAIPASDGSNVSYKLLEILSKEEAVGKRKIIELYVSSETGYYKCGDITQDMPQEGMRIREDENVSWRIVAFNKIINFDYEKKHSYKLLIEEIILDNPATAGDGKVYKLIKILSKERSCK